MTDNSGSAPPGQRDGSSENSADRDINVGAQAGIIVGDVYANFGHDGTPKGKYEAAVSFLRSSAGRTAARLIREAVDDNFRGEGAITATEIAYHWALAVLSDRSYEQLDHNDFEEFDRARKIAGAGVSDKYLVPLAVICKLFDGLQRQARDDGPDPAFGEIGADYNRLPENFKEDFQRHLSLMLAGGIDDNLEEILASNAEQQRMSNGGRVANAWKFFEARPEKPREREVTQPEMSPGSWALAGIGVLAGLLGLALAGHVLLLHGGILKVALLAVLIVVGGAVAAWCLVHYQAEVERLADKEREFGSWRVSRYSTPPSEEEDPERGLPDESEDDDDAEKARKARAQHKRFVRMATSFLNEQFRKHAPKAQAGRRRWENDTKGLKESLRAELLAQYKDPDPEPASLNWLINYRVAEIARKFREGSLRDYRKQMQPHLAYLLSAAAGTIVGAASLAYGLTQATISQPRPALLSILALLAAGFACLGSKFDVYLVRCLRFKTDKADARTQHEAEMAEYDAWIHRLEGTPTDEEMARWLDYDKLYLKKLVMAQLGLVNRDILSHATLTEPAPGCTLARWRNGPPRATVYLVTVFLLTRAGVRQVTTRLNFRNGDVYNQQRRSFRYDAIVSASVNETGVRYHPGRRQAMSPENPWTGGQDASGAVALHEEPQRTLNGKIILRLDFQLSLGNRDRIDFLVENFEDWDDQVDEDPLRLLDLALDTSGIAAALEVLEAISGHGAQWVEERIRRRRRWTKAA